MRSGKSSLGPNPEVTLLLPTYLSQYLPCFTIQSQALSNLLARKLLGLGPWLHLPVDAPSLGGPSTSFSPQADNPMAGAGRERSTGKASVLGKSTDRDE